MGTKQIYVIGEISIYSVNFELLVNDFLGSSQFKRKADASKVSFLLLLHFTQPPPPPPSHSNDNTHISSFCICVITFQVSDGPKKEGLECDSPNLKER